LAVSNYWLSNQ